MDGNIHKKMQTCEQDIGRLFVHYSNGEGRMNRINNDMEEYKKTNNQCMEKMNDKIENIEKEVIKISGDVGWIKSFFWLFISSAVGSIFSAATAIFVSLTK